MPIPSSFDDFLLRTDTLYIPRNGNAVTVIKVVDQVFQQQRFLLVRFNFEHKQRFLMVMTPDSDSARTRTVALEDAYGDIMFMDKTTGAEQFIAAQMIQAYRTSMSTFT